MNKMLLEQILKEELLVMKLNHQIMVEHKTMVAERTDWYSLVAEEYMKLEQGEDFDSSVIEEGVWSKIKYYMAKLPNLEKGGKIFGRTKRTKAAAEKLEAAIAKAAEKGFGNFRKKLKADYPEFPNMESKEEFNNALLDIGAVYDSLDAVVGKGIDAVSANAVVDALREYVSYLLDYELSDTYKHFNEGKDPEEDLEEAVGKVASTAAPERRTPRRTGTPGGGGAPEDPNAPKGKFTKRGAQGDSVESATMAGLASNKLPAILALSGAAGVLAGMLAKSGWALDALKQLRGIKDVQQVARGVEKIRTVLSPQSGEGFTQMFGRIVNADPSTFGPNTDPQALFGVMKTMGIDPQNPTQLFELGVDPQAYSQAIQGGAKTIGEMFPASNRELWLDKGTEAAAEVTKEITKKLGSGAAGGAAAVAAGQLAAASALASTLGIGLVAAGAAVKLIRMKGKKSSRAQLLNDLAKELQPFDVPDSQKAIDPPVDVTPAPSPEPEDDQQGGGDQGGGDEEETEEKETKFSNNEVGISRDDTIEGLAMKIIGAKEKPTQRSDKEKFRELSFVREKVMNIFSQAARNVFGNKVKIRTITEEERIATLSGKGYENSPSTSISKFTAEMLGLKEVPKPNKGDKEQYRKFAKAANKLKIEIYSLLKTEFGLKNTYTMEESLRSQDPLLERWQRIAGINKKVL
jgi:hypothetical protein